MFHPCEEGLLLSEAGLQGLCLSLNTPVVNIEQLPVGPARAAIVLFDAGWGTLSLGVGIRSIETRRVAVFVYRGLIDETKTPGETMNAALAFAEGMGFLFDDDLVGSGPEGAARALAAWNELTDETGAGRDDDAQREPGPAPWLSSAPPAAEELVLEALADDDGAGEILLEELSGELEGPAEGLELEPGEEEGEPAGAPPPPRAAARRRRVAKGAAKPPGAAKGKAAAPPPAGSAAADGGRRVPLSRFRKPTPEDEVAADDAGANSAPELGRVSIVRKQVGADAAERPSLLMRILTSF